MQCTFEHLSGSKAGQLEQLQGERITMGRDPANTLSFDPMKDLDVSGHHAQLAVGDDGKYMLTDLGSRNGTFLNGQKIAGTVCAEPGSKIQLGKGGPELKIAYTPGAKKPGATRMLLAQVQQSLEDEKAKSAKTGKTTMIVGIVAGVLVIGGALTAFLVSSHNEKVKTCDIAAASSEEMEARAKRDGAENAAADEWKKASDLRDQAQALQKKGDYEKATAMWKDAKAAFDQADFNAGKAERDALANQAKAAADDALKQAAQRIKEMQDQQDAMKAKFDADTAAKQQEMQNLADELAKAGDAKKAELEAQMRALKARTPDPAVLRDIVAKYTGAVCFIHSESFVQPAGSKDRSVIAQADGTGFVVGADMIAAAKHTLQPWKYNPEYAATAKKMKDENKLDVQDYVEIWIAPGPGQPFAKKYDSAGGTCKIAKLGEDKLSATEQTVQINWNMQPTKVPGIKVHEPATNDCALIQVPGAAFTPCPLGDKGADKFDPVVIMGNSRDAKGTITPAQPRGEVGQDATDQLFHIALTFPATYSGAPVFRYDQSVWGIVVGTDTNNATCIPISKLLELQKAQ